MKRLAASLAVLAAAYVARGSNTTNLFPNGDFESGGAGAWTEGGGGDTFSYPATGGNPGGYGVIDDTSGTWGIWVGGADTPLSLASLGLVAGQSYTFIQDMEIISGTNIGGIKIESWGPSGVISDSGDIYPGTGTASWKTYTFAYTIDPAATGLKIVPLWGPNSVVGFDNIGVVVPGPSPLAVSITSPTNSQVLSSNFTISATASVYPGSVTNVNFYSDNSLLGNSASSPFSFSASGVAAGVHALTAVASDSTGNSATSTVVSVTVTNATPPPPSTASEPFNYPTGAFANGTAATGSGFTGNWILPNGNATIVAGLTYPSLPAGNNALQQANNGSARSLVTLASPLSTGTKYISFLIKGTGDSGGNWAGVYLKGDNTTSLFAGFRGGFSASQTSFGLGSVSSASTTPTGGSALGTTAALNNTNVHLIVLEIDFNTSTTEETVKFWADPPAGTNAPGVSPVTTVTTFDVGNISGLGLNLQGGSANLTLDEIRVGNTYADVVGANLTPTIPTTLALSIASAKQISWTAFSTNYYQPQKSDDNSTWSNLGGLLTGSAVTSIYDSSPAAFYQVLEITPQVSEAIVDGGFEVDGGAGTAFYWNSVGSEPPTRITSDFHSGTASVAISVTNADATPNTSEIQQSLSYAGGGPVSPGSSYNFSFWAKQVGSGVSYVQQYNVMWLDASSAVVGSLGWTTFSGGNGAWSKITASPTVAPANAVNALIQIHGATGAVPNGFGGVLIDDASLVATTPTGPTNVLSPIVQNGAVFTGTVNTNGVTATAATGNISFQTNSVGQSTGIVASGSASSAPALLPNSYTVTAIYSGDGTYIGSTNIFVVGGNPFGSASGTVSFSAGQAGVVLSGVAGNNYSVQRATNVTFTAGISNFPSMTAPAGGNVSATDNFSDLGGVPVQAFYRLHYLP
jgi:hypothetical protein